MFRRPPPAAAPEADAGAALPARIALGVLIAGAAGAIRVACNPILGDQAPFLMHIPAVVVASWFGGLAGGLSAAASGAVLVDVLFIEPRYTLSFYEPGRSGGILLFVLVSLGLAWQVGRWRSAERALRVALADRQRTEGVLQRYELLARHSRDIVLFVRRDDGRVLEANAAAETAYGFTREELLARTVYDLRDPDDVTRITEQMTAAEAGGILFEARHRRRDGSTFPAEVSSRGMTVGGERVLLSVIRDITERARAEQSLRASERRMGALLNAVTESIWLFDREARVLLVNATAAERLGARAEDVVGRTMADLLPAALAESRRARFDEVIRTGVPVRFEDQRAGLVLDHTFYPVRDADGEVAGVTSFTRDNTARRRAEEQRAEAMARLTLLLEVSESLSAAATPEQITDILLEKAVPALGAYAGVVAILPDDGHEVIVLGSRGYAPGVTQPYARLPVTAPFPLTDAIRTGEMVVLGTLDDWRARYPSLTPDRMGTGSRALAAIPLRGSRVLGAIGLSFLEPRELDSRDRTFAMLLARQAAQALERADLLVSERRAHAEAEQAGLVKDDFLATLSHELRTPLNAILGWSHMLLDGSLRPDSVRHALEVIARSARSQVRLVEEVLDISRIVRGQLHLDMQVLNLRTIIERAIDTIRPAAAAKTLSITSALPDGVVTVGDGDRLQQAVWNLLANAVKFTPAGGHVTVTAVRHDQELTVEVRDTGVGIPAEFLPHVFERFTQADSSSTRRYGGLGLGLAIVRHIVELHGGTVAAESAGDGAGACFRITLPVRDGPPAGPKATPAGELRAPMASGSSLAGVVALVVDDDGDARHVIDAILSGAGATVVCASSAGEGLELVASAMPDVLISDISMPGEDGYWLIRQVRALSAREARVAAIALTASGRPADRASALGAGFDHHVPKPVVPQELIAVVASAMRRAGTSTE